MMSVEMLNTALVIMWFVSAEQFTAKDFVLVERLPQSCPHGVNGVDLQSAGAIFQ
jgi:hypothetical protein